MTYGYSFRLAELNSSADSASLGVQLGRVCIKRDISVIDVAHELGVTRQTVYNWFCGVKAPHETTVAKIEAYLSSLEAPVS